MKRNIKVIGGMLLVGSLIAAGLFTIFRKKILSPEKRIIARAQSKGLSKQAAKVVLAISQHETANLTSQLSQPPYNNYFGMHFPTTRKTTAIDKDLHNWAKFKDLEGSVDDFILWWLMYNRLPSESPEQTVSFMKSKNYFTDTEENYIRGVNYYLSKL